MRLDDPVATVGLDSAAVAKAVGPDPARRRRPGQRLETTPHRSRLMRRVGQRDTPPEKAVRKILHRLGARYRLHPGDLPGSPDVVNRTKRWAIFVHGCFWHAHDGCARWRLPKRNREFWAEKFESNRERDHRKITQLEELGFAVLVVWECETRATERLHQHLETFLQWTEERR